jgi:1L-myo-inositol 1-phosphate cytidylyltransferase
MHAVILAAGDGGRLQPLTDTTPKPLLRLGGRPIVNHVLDALFAAGVRETTFVLGYLGQQIRTAVDNLHPCGMSIRFVENPAFDEGNARSLWAARDAVDGPFLLAMADHLVEPSLVAKVTTQANGRCLLAVEYAPSDDARRDEATLARVQDGRIVDLGKGIADWNALDTGVFWCTPGVFDAITPELRDGEAGAVFAWLARAGKLDAVDVTGHRWLDVDTADDLRAADDWLAAAPGVR